MFYYNTDKYIMRLLDKTNKEELKEVQRLRYLYLLKAFNPNLPDDGYDDDGEDFKTDSIIVVEKATNKIVGTYRLSTKKTVGHNKFISSKEFCIDSLLNTPFEIVELGRAVVADGNRNGAVIQLLWAGIFAYAEEHQCKLLFGTCSLLGIDPNEHKMTLSYLNKHSINQDYLVLAPKSSFTYPTEEVDDIEALNNMPSLLKAYLKLGATVSQNGYIDYEFKSCDVMIILDYDKINKKYLEYYTRVIK